MDKNDNAYPEVVYSHLLSELVLYLKSEYNISLRKIAESIQIHSSSISMAKNGRKEESAVSIILEKICRHYDIKISIEGNRYVFKSNRLGKNSDDEILKSKISLLVSESKIWEAINVLQGYFSEVENDSGLDEIVLVKSDLNNFEELERKGLVEAHSILLFKNKINVRVLKICNFHLKNN